MKDAGHIFNDKYELLENNGYEKQSVFKCLICENIFSGTIHNASRKEHKMCPFCEVSSKSATKEQCEYKLKALGEEYEILEFTSMQKAKLKHSCGHIIENGNISRILRKNTKKCIDCAHGSIAYTPEYVKNEIFKETDGEYSVIEDYSTEKVPILFKHNICGHIWKCTRRNFLYNSTRCPMCWRKKSRSKVVALIENRLKEITTFETEKIFDLCYNKQALPFDFFIKDMNLVIEYDGEQHFKMWNRYPKEEKISYYKNELVSTHIRDLLKTDFCISNGINILRISYLTSKDIINMIMTNLKTIDLSKLDCEYISYNNSNKDYYKKYYETLNTLKLS